MLGIKVKLSHSEHPNLKIEPSKVNWADPFNSYTCSECNIPVSESTKHCNACGKCIIGFDHHCIWLNHCIGLKNHSLFIIFLIFLNLAVLSLSLLLLNLLMKYREIEGMKIKSIRGKEPVVTFWKVMTIIFTILNFCVFLFLLQLFLFHVYLKCKGTTTFDFFYKSKKKKQLARFSKVSEQLPD